MGLGALLLSPKDTLHMSFKKSAWHSSVFMKVNFLVNTLGII